MSRPPTDLVVVGGGLAGLSAALTAADAGATVTLLESRPRLGGATFSFPRRLTDRRFGDRRLEVDNGQHVFLRCCTAYRSFLRRLGADSDVAIQDRLTIPVLAPGAAPARLRRGRLPAPLHLAAALTGYRALGAVDRLRVLPAALALRRLHPGDASLDEVAFGDWLTAHGQREPAFAGLWDLVTTATLNLPAREASLQQAAFVFRTGLLDGSRAGDLGLPTVPLGRLHGQAATHALAARGVQVRTGARVDRVHDRGQTLTVTTGGRAVPAEAVVLAVSHEQLAALLPPGGLRDPTGPRRLGSSPIVNAHIVLDRPVLPVPFAAGLRTPIQWIFDRTAAAGLESDGQYLTVSLSAAREWVDRPTAELRAVLEPALRRLLPAAQTATVLEFFVTRERTATFRAAPGCAALRPGPRTGVPGLYLAGAWTDTGWPATMEGAVRSGRAAAALALAGLGRRLPAWPAVAA